MAWYEEISPSQFEMICLKKLKEYGEKEHLRDFTIEHNIMRKAADGKYQLDILATFTALSIKHTVVCECKRYRDKIKRELVSVLYNRVLACSANKGVLMAVNGFQRGAIEFAQKHGIALLNVVATNPNFPVPGNANGGGNGGMPLKKWIDYMSNEVELETIVSLFPSKKGYVTMTENK